MTKIPRRIDYSKKFVGMGGVFPTYKQKNDHAHSRIETWECSICGNDVHYLSEGGTIRRPGSSLTHDCNPPRLHSQTSINK